MVTIATFHEPAKAKHLKTRLQEAGVNADIHNEARLQMVAGGKPQANAKVMVEEDQFEKANSLMHDWERNDADIGAAIRCPQCQSPRLEYPQLTRKFLTPWLASVLFALKIFPKEFYCQDCHFTWTNEPEHPRYRFWNRFFSGPESEG
jgi:predicted Zn-ribbon and HTH transcriptional regulator